MALYNIEISNGFTEKTLPCINDLDNYEVYSLPQIDNITSKFADERSFILDFVSKRLPYFKSTRVYLTQKSNPEKTKKIIYNDKYITEITDYLILNNTSQLDEEYIYDYIENIKKYSLTDYDFKSIEDCNYFPQKLKIELENYRRIKKSKNLSDIQVRELPEIEKNIAKYLCSYFIFRNVRLWENHYTEELEQIMYDAQCADYQNINDEDYFISDPYLKEVYDKCDGDIELIIGILGEDYLEALSAPQQNLIGFTNYKQRSR
jgi:hypothetical protein